MVVYWAVCSDRILVVLWELSMVVVTVVEMAFFVVVCWAVLKVS